MTNHLDVTRAVFGVNTLLIAGVVAFGLAGQFALALAAFCFTAAMREMNRPLYTSWLNQHITDSRVRATVLSPSGQADALRQALGGPLTGLVGTVFSVHAAITAGG